LSGIEIGRDNFVDSGFFWANFAEAELLVTAIE